MRALVVAVQFACPSCARQYSVKDELAGKSAKCGQCGHKMKIPAADAVAASTSSAAKVHSPVTQPSAPKLAALKPTAAKPAAAKLAPLPTAKAAPAKARPSDPGMSSWLDEELESVRVEAKNKPQPPAPSDSSCPSCSGPLPPGSVMCVKCGYDTRIRGKRTVSRSAEAPAKQRSMLGSAASLLRGSFFSFLGAMLGAIIWAVLAYATMREFGIVAWGLGGLAGFGMALGHESDDGTFPGIVAAFMSLLGIIAAKVFIVIIFIAAFVSSAVSEMEIVADNMAAAESGELDPIESKREALALAMALQDISNQGADGEFNEGVFKSALSKSRESVANLTPEEIEAKINELGNEEGLDGEMEDEEEGALAADETEEFGEDEDFDESDAEGADVAEVDIAEAEADEEAPTFGSVVGSLFGPMDGIWILFAFFTAYKVGSGEAGD